MSWVAVGVGVVGSVGGALMGRQKAPEKANYNPVNVADEQGKAIAGNLANFDSAKTLASKQNSFAQSETARLLEAAMPGYAAVRDKLMKSVNSDLDNQTNLPPEVQQKMAQFAAEKGITRGTSGGFNGFNLVKDFGFNMLDWQQASRARAISTLGTLFNTAPKVNPMSPMSMMIDPNTAIQVAGGNAQMQYNVDQAANNASAAARNHNASLMAGAFQGAMGAVAGGVGAMNAQRGVQAKTSSVPNNTGAKFTPAMLNPNTPAPTFSQSVFGNTPRYR